MADLTPQTVIDFVIKQLAALPSAARLAVVLDPFGDLALGETVEVEDRTWQVIRYDGNDLAFRQCYQSGRRDLIWVTCPPGCTWETPSRIVHRAV